MICDWLAHRECFFSPSESSKRVDVFEVRSERRSDVHTEDKRIKKEISPRTKSSRAKASLSEKLSKIKILHISNTSIVSLLNTKIDIFHIYIYNIIIIIIIIAFQ